MFYMRDWTRIDCFSNVSLSLTGIIPSTRNSPRPNKNPERERAPNCGSRPPSSSQEGCHFRSDDPISSYFVPVLSWNKLPPALNVQYKPRNDTMSKFEGKNNGIGFPPQFSTRGIPSRAIATKIFRRQAVSQLVLVVLA